jgi:predicted DNA-binding transcriptional regulator AlpA
MASEHSHLVGQKLAQFLGLSPRTLESWRLTGGAPAYIKVGRRVRHRRSDLEAWLDARRRTSTSDPGSSTAAE